MPRKYYKKKTTYKKKTYKKKKYQKKPSKASTLNYVKKLIGSSSINPTSLNQVVDTLAGSGIPNIVYVKQVYWDRIVLGDGVLTPYPYTFCINSTVDPNITEAGHQPKGRDYYATVYGKYTVIGCAYDVQFVTQGSAKKLVGCLITTELTMSSQFNNQIKIMETTSKYAPKRLCYGSSDAVKEEIVSIKGYVPMKKFIVDTNGTFAENFTSSIASTPATRVFMHCWGMNEDGTAIAVTNLSARVKLTYYVAYHQVIAQTSS